MLVWVLQQNTFNKSFGILRILWLWKPTMRKGN